MLYVIVLAGLISVLLLLEKNLTNGSKTPLYLVVVPLFVVIVLHLLFGSFLGYSTLRVETIQIIMEGVLVFALLSVPGVVFITCICKKSQLKIRKKEELQKPELWLIVTAFFVLSFLAVRLYSIGLETFFTEEGDDASVEFGGGGLSAHFLVLCIFISTVLITRKFTITSVCVLILSLLCLFLYQVKIWLFSPFIIGLIMRSDMGHKISILKLLLFGIGAIMLFVVAYIPVLGFSLDNLEFLMPHFCKYLFSGVAGFNEILFNHLPTGQSPYYGMPGALNNILGIENHIDSRYLNGVYISSLNYEETNVYTLFGMTYLFNGQFAGFIYLAGVALISTYFFLLKYKTRCYYWYNLSYYFWGLGLLLSFFGNYYALLNIYELSLLALIIGFVSRHLPSTYKWKPNTHIIIS